MKRLYLVLFISSIHCGTGSTQSSSFRLQISGESTDVVVPRITMQGGETRLVQLLVVGAVPGPVTFSAQGPAFVTLDGPLLTLSPARADQGEYAITVMAKSGSQTASTSLDLVVNRYNSPPRFFADTVGLGDDRMNGRFLCPNPSFCTAFGTPKLWLAGCDPEGDGMTMDVEVVIRGHPFSGQPSYSRSTSAVFNCGAGIIWNVTVSLPGLATEQSYDFAVRLTDQFGATNGWVTRPMWGFDQGPCVTRQCACAQPSGIWCEEDYECCSGVCIPNRSPIGGVCQ